MLQNFAGKIKSLVTHSFQRKLPKQFSAENSPEAGKTTQQFIYTKKKFCMRATAISKLKE
jgi:hypothetical protein